MGTGNYNGDTAKIYCDHSVLTSNKKLTSEINKVFTLILDFKPEKYKFNQLIVSPINMRSKFIDMIDNEIAHKKSGNPAYIKFKMNSLVDEQMIDKLYEASRAGVKVDLMIRGICCLNPDFSSVKNPISIISIVDKYLEHARVLIFHNNGNEKMYISSADWMVRNLDHRIEAAIPILNSAIQSELKDIINIQLRDNVKARILDSSLTNNYVTSASKKNIRSQVETYLYLHKKTLKQQHEISSN
jgi:polyphosphate kinase